MTENTSHYEGMGCTCLAEGEKHCSCILADWTPVEVYKLRKQIEAKDKRIAELEEEVQPLALYDFIESYEGLPLMQLWDWLMYNGYTKRVQEKNE